ncbi:uncharacterized protein ARMOST_02596 [Armillaria ostoyae]|uniref:Uncharacterized protein n=1 Tax=Armillaria ostoyae TaxID=47428 RepID=A0A284QSB9_ARMOS|nr:uncharacterized protein ARMOST_02596 [Armillaria ostoyae]
MTSGSGYHVPRDRLQKIYKFVSSEAVFVRRHISASALIRVEFRRWLGWLDSATANQDDHDRRTSFPFSPLHHEALAEESRYPESFYMDCRCGGGNISARGSSYTDFLCRKEQGDYHHHISNPYY